MAEKKKWKDPRNAIDMLQIDQGWTDRTLLDLSLRFIELEKLNEKFASYLGHIAECENQQSNTDDNMAEIDIETLRGRDLDDDLDESV